MAWWAVEFGDSLVAGVTSGWRHTW